jgi:hypothetical protein
LAAHSQLFSSLLLSVSNTWTSILVHKTNVLRLRNIPLLLFCTLSIHKHEFTFKHMCWHSITKILRNGPRAHFPFTSSIVEPIPRLEATQRTTQQRQPGAAVSAATNGPAVMTVAGGREQRSRRQPSSRPIRGQRENPLSRREDNAPVFRSSNGSRTRNGRPANHTPRRINSTAGQAAPLAGEAGDASPSP